MKKITLGNGLYLNVGLSEDLIVYAIEKGTVSEKKYIHYMDNPQQVKELLNTFTKKQQDKIKQYINKIIDNDVKLLSKIKILTDKIFILKDKLLLLRYLLNENNPF